MPLNPGPKFWRFSLPTLTFLYRACPNTDCSFSLLLPPGTHKSPSRLGGPMCSSFCTAVSHQLVWLSSSGSTCLCLGCQSGPTGGWSGPPWSGFTVTTHYIHQVPLIMALEDLPLNLVVKDRSLLPLAYSLYVTLCTFHLISYNFIHYSYTGLCLMLTYRVILLSQTIINPNKSEASVLSPPGCCNHPSVPMDLCNIQYTS
jgi:hypothetical protein